MKTKEAVPEHEEKESKSSAWIRQLRPVSGDIKNLLEPL